MAKSKLVSSMILGALAGAAVSMLDRATREHTVATTKKVASTVSYYASNRDELQEKIAEKIEQAQGFYGGASDTVQSLLGQVDGLKGMPETLQSMISDTKSAFEKQNEEQR
ncbi:hypothetical protein GCM10007425_28510 [Lysinibacillus alkalisoli]|uniref:YtxH domain-containing protein n=1 Tax=Lysinibacillus alkalisoli TaxID=1911548 RepID=A0A917GA78_9BACI|nr:YtxH domain-containing protein [Lysinibacillus alkalisoli]GGG32158.1 hypothetical protein GCM10007425_28510 [Lysinibacillus alkalisoli]